MEHDESVAVLVPARVEAEEKTKEEQCASQEAAYHADVDAGQRKEEQERRELDLKLRGKERISMRLVKVQQKKLHRVRLPWLNTGNRKHCLLVFVLNLKKGLLLLKYWLDFHPENVKKGHFYVQKQYNPYMIIY